MKVWVTKYAMSGKGVIPCEDARTTSYADMIAIPARDGKRNRDWIIHKPDWHTTPEAAISCAEEMRTKKIASLKKQIAKLEAMMFSAEE